MNFTLMRHVWRIQRIRLALVATGLFVWGFLMLTVYGKFGVQFRALMESGMIPEPFARFAGGDIFSLTGAVALAFIHPIAIILTSVFAVGFSSSAVAGERQRGTLEVVLARPVARQTLYLTLAAAATQFIGLMVTALIAGTLSGSKFAGVLGEFPLEHVPFLWVNGVMLFGAIAALGLAASVSFDRLPPAMGVTLAAVIVMYVFEVLGSLWPRAEFLQPYSLFHYLNPKLILDRGGEMRDLVVLLAATVVCAIWALVVFPRRDLAAPS